MELFLLFIGLLFISLIQDIMINYFSKKCNYDCSQCKVFDCSNHHCIKKRNKFNKQHTNEA